MRVDPIKTSFASGEFGPSLYGRTDIAQYQNACEIVENMLCRPYGSAISTPGTKFVREVKDSSKATRLIQFIFSRTDARIIEMGDLYMRLFSSSDPAAVTPLMLEDMEYATDGSAQAAYATNAGAIDQQSTDTGGNWALSGSGAGKFHEAQSFILSGAITITSVAVKSGTYTGSPSGDWTFRIETDSVGLPSGTLADASATVTVSAPAENTEIQGTFASSFALSASTTYWLVINCADQGAGNAFAVQSNLGVSSSYADGGTAYWTGGAWVDTYKATYDLYFKIYTTSSLQSYSEATIKTQGSYSLKAIATTSSSTKTLTRTVSPVLDLSTLSELSVDFYASRTGSNIKIGFHDSGGTTTEIAPAITTANTWQTFTKDISGVAAANKNAIDSIIITITNADAANTFYVDNIYGVFESIATPYTEDEIFDVQFAQLNDVIYLSHPDHRTKKLIRLSSTLWELQDFDFLGGPFQPDNTTAITITPSGTSGTITLTLSATNSTTYFSPSSSSTAGHNGSYWKVGGLTTSATTGLSVQGYAKVTSVTSSTVANATVMETLDGTGATTDWAEGSWSAVRGYPSRVAFHERRLFFARTDTEPTTVWGSQPFVYDEFSLNDQNDDDALNLPLASNEANEIMWLASGDVLVAGSFGGDFVISDGGTGEALTPLNAVSKWYANWGSEPIVPKKIGNFFFYIQRFGRKLRELFYFFDQNTYKSVDRTIFAPHITGDGVIEMAYQQNPESILWCVRSDGTIATLTREVDQEVVAWSRQVTDGYYESIATIPSQDGPYDEIWVIVNRTINGTTKRYIEVFGDIEPNASVDLMMYVHSGLTFDAYSLTSNSTISLSGSTTTTAATIKFTLSATTSTTYFDASDIGQRIRGINIDRETLGEAKITSVSSTTIAYGTVTTTFSTTSYAPYYWGKSAQTITGLDHLEAATVTTLADGSLDSSTHVVSNGTVTLGQDYFAAVIGLPYNQTLKTLPIEAGSQRGTAQGKIQRINQVGVKVNNSYDGFYVGSSLTSLERWTYRSTGTTLGIPEDLYTGVLPNKTLKGGFAYGASIVIKNSDPLPIEILSIMPALLTEDK